MKTYKRKKGMLLETPYLKLISGGRTLKIPKCEGGVSASLCCAKNRFNKRLGRWTEERSTIDFDIKYNELIESVDFPQPPVSEAEASVWQMYRPATISSAYYSFGYDLDRLLWKSQEQIEKFCTLYPDFFSRSYGTYFLFKENSSLYCAGVNSGYVSSSEPELHMIEFSSTYLPKDRDGIIPVVIVIPVTKTIGTLFTDL